MLSILPGVLLFLHPSCLTHQLHLRNASQESCSFTSAETTQDQAASSVAWTRAPKSSAPAAPLPHLGEALCFQEVTGAYPAPSGTRRGGSYVLLHCFVLHLSILANSRKAGTMTATTEHRAWTFVAAQRHCVDQLSASWGWNEGSGPCWLPL